MFSPAFGVADVVIPTTRDPNEPEVCATELTLIGL